MFLKKRKNFLRKIYMTVCFFAVGLLPEGVNAACAKGCDSGTAPLCHEKFGSYGQTM